MHYVLSHQLAKTVRVRFLAAARYKACRSTDQNKKKHEGNGPIDSRAMVTITDNKSTMLNIASRLSYFTGTEIISVNPDKRESPNIIH